MDLHSREKENNENSLQRKHIGAYYTPTWIVKVILYSIVQYISPFLQQSPTTILSIADITCGTGNFVCEIPSFFSNVNIWGFDTDEVALNIGKKRCENQWMHGKSNFNGTFQFENKNSLLDPHIISYFHIVLGNPPWGINLSPHILLLKKKYPMLFQGSIETKNDFIYTKKIRDQIDSFAFFLLRNLDLLLPDGILALIVPATILVNPVYQPLRYHLIYETTVLQIDYLGDGIFKDVNMPSIIIYLRKKPPTPTHSILVRQLIKSPSERIIQPQWNEHTLLQSIFLVQHFYNWCISGSMPLLEAFHFIDTSPHYKFGDFVQNSRGVEIGKEGNVYLCPLCKHWNPSPIFRVNSQSVITVKCNHCHRKIKQTQIHQTSNIIQKKEDLPSENSGWVPILFGEHIKPYSLSTDYYLDLSYQGIRYKSPSQYSCPKILLRKTGEGIIGAIDYQNFYTLQVVYQFSSRQHLIDHVEASNSGISSKISYYSMYSLELLFGIITSRFIVSYYKHKFGYPFKKTFPHLIQRNLMLLPIPVINFSDQTPNFNESVQKIIQCVKKLHHEKQKNPENENCIKTLLLEREQAVLQLFRLNPSILQLLMVE